MARVMDIISSTFRRRGKATGKAVIAKVRDLLEGVREQPLYLPPGIRSRPTKGDKAVVVPAGSSFSVIVAAHNYKIDIEPGEGETVIYSTDSAGETVKSTIKLDATGNIDLNGNGRTLVTHAELDTAIQGLVSYINGHAHIGVTTGGGTSGPPASPTSVDISSAEAATLRTN